MECIREDIDSIILLFMQNKVSKKESPSTSSFWQELSLSAIVRLGMPLLTVLCANQLQMYTSESTQWASHLLSHPESRAHEDLRLPCNGQLTDRSDPAATRVDGLPSSLAVKISSLRRLHVLTGRVTNSRGSYRCGAVDQCHHGSAIRRGLDAGVAFTQVHSEFHHHMAEVFADI